MLIKEYIGHVFKMSVSGYSDRHFKPLLHQFAVSLSKTLIPQCVSRLNCLMSIRRENPREGCFFSAMSLREEIVLKIHALFSRPSNLTTQCRYEVSSCRKHSILAKRT